MANLSNLERYIITYPSSEPKKYLCNIFDFYNTYMKGLKPEWTRDFGPRSMKVLCFNPNHIDAAPSMGAFKNKSNGIYMYHCFGCGASGNVVDLYIMYIYYRTNHYIDRDAACKGLAELYNIPLDENLIANIVDTSVEQKVRPSTRSYFENYNLNDFQRALLKARTKRKGNLEDLDKIGTDYVYFLGYLRGMYSNTYQKKELVDTEESN